MIILSSGKVIQLRLFVIIINPLYNILLMWGLSRIQYFWGLGSRGLSEQWLFTLPWYDVCSDWELWKGENSE